MHVCPSVLGIPSSLRGKNAEHDITYYVNIAYGSGNERVKKQCAEWKFDNEPRAEYVCHAEPLVLLLVPPSAYNPARMKTFGRYIPSRLTIRSIISDYLDLKIANLWPVFRSYI